MRPLGGDEFAYRFSESEMEGWFAKEVEVREGFLALLLVDGKLDRVLTPGKYTLSTFWQGLLHRGPRKEVVLARSSELPFKFSLQNLLTADPLFLTAECSVTLQLQRGAEQLFYVNLMRENPKVTLIDLRALVFPSLRDGAATWFGERTLETLAANPNFSDLAMSLEAAVQKTLSGKGVTVVRVDPQNPFCEAWDDRTRKLAQTLQEVWKLNTDLDRRKKLGEAQQAGDLQAIEEETAKLSTFQKRADLWDRLRQAFSTAEMSRLRGDREMEDFVRQMDKDKLLKDDDFERLKRTLRDNREDEEKARAHLVRTADLERDYEYKMLELRKRKDLTTSEVEFRQGLARLQLQGEYDLERQKLDFDVERARKQAEKGLAQRAAEDAFRRTAELEQAKTQAQARGQEREARRLDEELRLAIKEREMAIQRTDQAERQRLDLERREKDLDIEIRRRRADQDLQLQRIQKEHEIETQRIDTLNKASITTLVSISDPAKAPILADLAALEIKKGMTYDQILALAAEKNPQVMSYMDRAQTTKPLSEEEKRLYERIITEQKDSAAKTSQFFRENQEMFLRIHNKSMETIADVAKALGHQPTSAAPQSPTPVQPPSAPYAAVVCSRCHKPAPTGTNYCPNCGENMAARA